MMELKRISEWRRLLLALPLIAGTSATYAQLTPVEIPSSLHGTYALEYSSAQPGAPLRNGDTATMVLAPGGALCIADYLLLDPRADGPGSAEALWSEPGLDVQLAVSDIRTGFNEVNVLTGQGDFLGQLTGTKISASTDCGPLGATPPEPATLLELFRLAEEQYADLFPAETVSTAFRMLDGFLYRHYTGSGMYIGINEGSVYLAGGDFGGTPVAVGSLAATLQQLRSEVTDEEPIDVPVDEPVVDIPAGDFRLVISGTVSGSVMGVSFTEPLSLQVDSIEAPGSSDIDGIEQAVRDAMEEVSSDVDATTIGDISVSEVDVGDDRVFFRVQFSASTTTQGFTINSSYDLDYEYLRN